MKKDKSRTTHEIHIRLWAPRVTRHVHDGDGIPPPGECREGDLAARIVPDRPAWGEASRSMEDRGVVVVRGCPGNFR